MDTTYMDAIETAYATATGQWDGADWPHERTLPCSAYEHGQYHPCPGCKVARDEDGQSELCAGDNAAECQTCADAAADASAAEVEANFAIDAARAGNWDEAVERAVAASELESEYGDDPTWGDFRAAVEAAAEAAEAAVEAAQEESDAIAEAIEQGMAADAAAQEV